MVSSFKSLGALVHLSLISGAFALALDTRASDPCSAIAGKKWVAPKDVRACYDSIGVNPAIKTNILDVVNKTLAFHASTNYQIQAPPPFSNDVHEDLLADVARIRGQSYKSDYDLHRDLSSSVKRVNDGHCAWINLCYDSAYVNYLPTPLVLLADHLGFQHVHIAPEAFSVASAEFPDQIDVWQKATNGKLESLNGAKVLLINGRFPFDVVNANTKVNGGFQAFGTRQNGFFSSYVLGPAGWNYAMGDFARQSLPISDEVTLVVHKVGRLLPETVVLPYRSRIGNIKAFNDGPSYYDNNCRASAETNGHDITGGAVAVSASQIPPVAKFQQQPDLPLEVTRKFHVNVMLDAAPPSDVVLPPTLTPALPAANGSFGVAQFYMLKDGKTGVLALGSFSDPNYFKFVSALVDGLTTLKEQGATKLIVDVTNNGGGFVCAAHLLHRVIVGAKATTEPTAGLDTTARAGPLAQLISKFHVANPHSDPTIQLLFNPLNWVRAENNQPFNSTDDWLQPVVPKVINGRQDAFSTRLGTECPPDQVYPANIPKEGLFDPKNVVIVSNGRCASSCSLFSITMAKHEGTRTVVVGGRRDVPQQYCGIVGGQSTDFATIDTEIKSSRLKDHALAPPDMMVNGIQGITWRLGFGIDKRDEPEEWQNHPATHNLPLTKALVNKPVAIWEEVARKYLS